MSVHHLHKLLPAGPGGAAFAPEHPPPVHEVEEGGHPRLEEHRGEDEVQHVEGAGPEEDPGQGRGQHAAHAAADKEDGGDPSRHVHPWGQTFVNSLYQFTQSNTIFTVFHSIYVIKYFIRK